jgi:hypothetical protein
VIISEAGGRVAATIRNDGLIRVVASNRHIAEHAQIHLL